MKYNLKSEFLAPYHDHGKEKPSCNCHFCQWVKGFEDELREMQMRRPTRCSKPIYDLIKEILGE